MLRPLAAIRVLPVLLRRICIIWRKSAWANRFISSNAHRKTRRKPCVSNHSLSNRLNGGCMVVDLNADLGEGCGNDEALLQLVSSANIACGFHAGDAQTMQQSVRGALKYGVAIGAHPGFPDRENFGRTAMQLPPETVYAQVVYQLGALAAITRAEGGNMVHVKPHGMLYNQAATDAVLADAIARAVQAVDPALRLVGLAGSELIRAGE